MSASVPKLKYISVAFEVVLKKFFEKSEKFTLESKMFPCSQMVTKNCGKSTDSSCENGENLTDPESIFMM